MHYVDPTSKLQPSAFDSFRERSPQSPFSEAEEMELAVELLEVASEAELDQFLGNLLKKAWKGIEAVGSSVIRPLGGVLKTVANAALPTLATAAGTFFGGPAGGAIAGKLGSLVSQTLEAEVSGTAADRRDLEMCRQFVRMAGKAARAAALAPAGINPIELAQKTLANSAQQKLARGPAAASRIGSSTRTATTGTAVANGGRCRSCGQRSWNCKCGRISQTGRWVRHGPNIVIVNC